MKLFFAFGFLLALFAVVSAAIEVTEEDEELFGTCMEYMVNEILWESVVPHHPGYAMMEVVSDDDTAQKSVLQSEEDGPKLYRITDMETNVTFTCPDCSVDPCCSDRMWTFLKCSAGCLVDEAANDYGVKFAYGFEVVCTGIPPPDCSPYTCPSRRPKHW